MLQMGQRKGLAQLPSLSAGRCDVLRRSALQLSAISLSRSCWHTVRPALLLNGLNRLGMYLLILDLRAVPASTQRLHQVD